MGIGRVARRGSPWTTTRGSPCKKRESLDEVERALEESEEANGKQELGPVGSTSQI